MITEGNADQHNKIAPLIKEKLKPYVKKVDLDAFYAEDYLLSLGKAGLFQSPGHIKDEVVYNEMQLVEETAKTCMTTAFNLWCHLASLTYLRCSDKETLKRELLPQLENGGTLGATGLSNPMKNYAGLEPLHLQAERKEEGWILSGNLPSVSNLGKGHWFGAVANTNEGKHLMAFVPCEAEGLKFKEKADYLGVNGSATFACQFNDVFIPEKWIISTNAQQFIKKIRPYFVLYQVPLGLGIIEASIESIRKASRKQGGANCHLTVQADELAEKHAYLRNKLYTLVTGQEWTDILKVRLAVAKLALKAVQADMLHNGGAAYLQKSNPARRLKESYFLANLTPTIRHLEKLLTN
ncbi:acyl-CoA dehydrogenase family protein [Thalassobacillus devorans]|uniref:acyl-CoA dehydrogenase family protein n=1 Tax=Thalassobacillus devorans TaxID=279813 RepID=UPI000A1CA3AE|nr:acyl-CoA dehydrogenase family protein [Thalassobacillus devorans]